jgi:hypothetical protein
LAKVALLEKEARKAMNGHPPSVDQLQELIQLATEVKMLSTQR